MVSRSIPRRATRAGRSTAHLPASADDNLRRRRLAVLSAYEHCRGRARRTDGCPRRRRGIRAGESEGQSPSDKTRVKLEHPQIRLNLGVRHAREASMGTLLQDLRFALRSLRRAPAFPLAAIATLALGIGATTAIFSTLNAVLLKPLPYPKSEDLYNIRTTLVDGRVTTGMLSNGELSRLNAPDSPIVRAAGMQPTDLTLLHAGRHAAAREGLRRHRGFLRAVRPADDTRRLHPRPLRPAGAAAAQRAARARRAAARRDLASRLAGSLSPAIRRSSASRSGSPRSPPPSPASRRATSTRRTAATSGSRSSSTRTTSITSSTVSCA